MTPTKSSTKRTRTRAPAKKALAGPRPEKARPPQALDAIEEESEPFEAEEMSAEEPEDPWDEPEEALLEEVPSSTALAPIANDGTQALAPPRAPMPLAKVAPREGASDQPLAAYMREVTRHPLLSREEEHDLAVRYFNDKGDLDAAYKLVASNLRLVVKIAYEYRRTAMSLLDLIQEGNIGLMHAVQKFDPYRGVKLSSYAAWWIRAYMIRYVMENCRLVKLGTTQAQRKLFFNLQKERDKLISQGVEPTTLLLAQRLDVSERDVSEMEQRLTNEEVSIDAPLGEDDRATRAEKMPLDLPRADDRLADLELQEIMREKLAAFGARLQGREKYLFEKRITAEEPLTLQQIGDLFGLTRERARQIEAKVMRDLRAWLRTEFPDFQTLLRNPEEEAGPIVEAEARPSAAEPAGTQSKNAAPGTAAGRRSKPVSVEAWLRSRPWR